MRSRSRLSVVLSFSLMSLSHALALDTAWRAETDAKIKEIRQRDVQIRVVDGQGQPIAAGQREQIALSEDEDAELQARLEGFGYLG